MADLIIRPVTEDDADSLADMWLALVSYHQSLDHNLPGAARGGEHRYVRRILERLDDAYTCALMAEVNGQPVGFALGMIVDLMGDIFAQEPGGFLADIYVEPSHRRAGVGRALVESLKDWFQERKVTYFDWHVASANQEGLAFWRSVGGQDVMLRMRADLTTRSRNQHD